MSLRRLNDPVVWAGGLVLGGYVLLYALPLLTPDQMDSFSRLWSEPVLLVVVLFALVRGLRRITHREEKRFWGLMTANFACWFGGSAIVLLIGDGPGPEWGYLAIDSLFVISYLACFLAVDLKPHLSSGWSERDLAYGFSTVGTLLAFFTLVLYFFLLPSLFHGGADNTVPSYYLIIALGLLLAIRFGHLCWTCRDRQWRPLYGLLTLMAALWTVSDSLEYAIYSEKLDLAYGTAWDFFWYAPFALPIVVRRVRQAAASEPRPTAAVLKPQWDEWQTDAPDLLLLYAFSIPVFHLTLNTTGMLDGEGLVMRESLILASLLAFVTLAVLQHRLSQKRNRDLRSALTVLVMNEQVQQSQKMEAVGRLAGGMAHDFNNLLTVIQAQGDVLLEELNERDPLRARAEEIAEAADRAGSLTRSLLAFGRKKDGEPRSICINTVVDDSRTMLRRLIGERVRIEIALASDLGATRIDAGQLLQIILNLAVNARDAMPEGGRLRLETSNVVLSETDTEDAPSARPGPYVMLSASDTGCGMDEATRSRVFEPFFTGKTGGTGLGLATVYGIVTQNDGHIRFTSRQGEGTTFCIYLPRVADDPPQAVSERRAEIPLSAPGSSTVLLVEDEERVRVSVRDLLRRSGFQVLEATDGLQAARIQQGHPGRIDLLLTDVVLPGMSGWELARRVRNAEPRTRVLYMSGYVEESERAAAMEPQSVFLRKPFTLEDLTDKLQEVMAGGPPTP